MNIIEEYRSVTESIAVTKSQLTSARRELQKNIDIYKPSGAKAITYDQERVQSSMYQQSIVLTANNFCEINIK